MSSLILIVDDDILILNAVKRLLRRDKRFTILTFNSANDALEKLKTLSPAVILSDMRMPEINGLTFLSKAKEICPDSIRIILSGYADTSLIIDSINLGEIWRYLLKPWDDSNLIQTISNARDLYESRRREEAAQEKIIQLNRRLQNIISSVYDGVLITDSDGFCIITNKAFKNIYPAEIISHPVEDFFTAMHSDKSFEEIISSGKARGTISEIHVDISVGRYDESIHNNAFLVLVIRNITREHEVEQLKSDFVASVSHELRTPLSSIIGFSKMMLRNDSLPVEEQHEFLSIILQEAERLSSLVENVLNLSTIESGVISYSFKPILLRNVIDNTVSTLLSSLKESNIFIDVESTADSTIPGDFHALMQVFVNLLSNAIKFTPAKGNIQIKLHETAETISVSISDTGMGIPENELTHIFDRFYRVKGRNVKGTGIGLHLVQEIIKAHHGEIEVKSTLGEGSIFTISFPVSNRITEIHDISDSHLL